MEKAVVPSDRKPILIVVAGPNGSGKTTITSKILHHKWLEDSVYIVCTESPAINAARIANRVIKGGHDVPITKIVSRYQKSISNCKYLSKIVHRAYLYDNSKDGEEASILIRLANGKIVKRYTDIMPRWATKIIEE